MLSLSERRRLERAYGERIDARAALAKCAAGLIIVAGIAAIGVATSSEEDQSAAPSITARSVASGR